MVGPLLSASPGRPPLSPPPTTAHPSGDGHLRALLEAVGGTPGAALSDSPGGSVVRLVACFSGDPARRRFVRQCCLDAQVPLLSCFADGASHAAPSASLSRFRGVPTAAGKQGTGKEGKSRSACALPGMWCTLETPLAVQGARGAPPSLERVWCPAAEAVAAGLAAELMTRALDLGPLVSAATAAHERGAPRPVSDAPLRAGLARQVEPDRRATLQGAPQPAQSVLSRAQRALVLSMSAAAVPGGAAAPEATDGLGSTVVSPAAANGAAGEGDRVRANGYRPTGRSPRCGKVGSPTASGIVAGAPSARHPLGRHSPPSSPIQAASAGSSPLRSPRSVSVIELDRYLESMVREAAEHAEHDESATHGAAGYAGAAQRRGAAEKPGAARFAGSDRAPASATGTMKAPPDDGSPRSRLRGPAPARLVLLRQAPPHQEPRVWGGASPSGQPRSGVSGSEHHPGRRVPQARARAAPPLSPRREPMPARPQPSASSGRSPPLDRSAEGNGGAAPVTEVKAVFSPLLDTCLFDDDSPAARAPRTPVSPLRTAAQVATAMGQRRGSCEDECQMGSVSYSLWGGAHDSSSSEDEEPK